MSVQVQRLQAAPAAQREAAQRQVAQLLAQVRRLCASQLVIEAHELLRLAREIQR